MLRQMRRLEMNVCLCAEGRESSLVICLSREESSIETVFTCATECSDLVSITLLTTKEFSFDDSRAFLLIILPNRKSNKYINILT